MNRVKLVSGFTIVEMMLAMAFIAALLVAIAMTTVQIGHIYNKGLTLREVNQAGRAVATELQRSINATSPFDVNPSSPATRYIVRPGGGRLCVGRYSYAWNYGSALAGAAGAPAIYNVYDDTTPVLFAKVNDPSASLCTVPGSSVKKSEATELLAMGDRNLVLHAFSIANVASDIVTNQSLYAISFTLGTNERTQLTTNDSSCKPPSQGQGNQDYCSVNQFSLIIRAGNKSGGGL